MPEQSNRLGGHLRRHGVAYAVGVFAFSFSPVPAMAADLVTTAEIANGAVTLPKLALDSVNSTRILDESIIGSDIKNGSVGSVDLLDNSVLGVDLKDGTVGGADLGPNSVNGAKVSDGSLSGDDILDNTLTGSDIGPDSITSNHVADGSIKGEDLNLLNDNQCTGETVLGKAQVDVSAVVSGTSAGVTNSHSCSGESIIVYRAGVGFFYLYFSGNPSVLALGSPVAYDTPAYVSVQPYYGYFLVGVKDKDGNPADLDFSVVAY